MRWAHRDVWCSKVSYLIEAELFAAQDKRPALSGRALLCAAVDARKIQGLTASQNLPDARNRAPVTPVSLRERRESRRKGGLGESRGGKGTIWCPCPLLSPPPDGGTLGRRRRPLSTLTSSVKSPPAEAIPSADGIEIKSPCSLGELQGSILFRGSSTHTLLRREGKNRSSNRKQLMNLCPPLAYDATRFGRK